MAQDISARVAVIGGSGLYDLMDDARAVEIATPFGGASAPIAVGSFAGTTVAFLARHGAGHTIAPHRVNYRANVWALASVGVRAIIGSSAVGSVNPDMPSDTFVVPDQLIDRTHGRSGTFFDGPDVQHLVFADPFDPVLRQAIIRALDALGEQHATTATTVVISGPRFSTRAESRGWRVLGGDIVNMTQQPEAALAAELGIGYASLSFVTDMDAGMSADDAVDGAAVMRRLSDARPRITAAIAEAIERIPPDYVPRELTAADAVDAVMGLDVG